MEDENQKFVLNDLEATYETCTGTFEMTDVNYLEVIDWLNKCVDLCDEVEQTEKELYVLKMMMNMKRMWKDFFSNSKLNLQNLNEAENEFSKLFHELGSKTSWGKFNTEDNLDEPKKIVTLSIYIQIAALISIILLIFIIALFVYIWFKKTEKIRTICSCECCSVGLKCTCLSKSENWTKTECPYCSTASTLRSSASKSMYK